MAVVLTSADLFAERKGQFKPESFLKKCGVRS